MNMKQNVPEELLYEGELLPYQSDEMRQWRETRDIASQQHINNRMSAVRQCIERELSKPITRSEERYMLGIYCIAAMLVAFGLAVVCNF